MGAGDEAECHMEGHLEAEPPEDQVPIQGVCDVLPSPSNLFSWGKVETPTCPLYSKTGTLEHNLSSNSRALSKGCRTRWDQTSSWSLRSQDSSSYWSSLCLGKRGWRRHRRRRGPSTRSWWRTVTGMDGGPCACHWKWAVRVLQVIDLFKNYSGHTSG